MDPRTGAVPVRCTVIPGACSLHCRAIIHSRERAGGTNLTLDTAAVQPNTSGKQAAIIHVFPAQAGTHV